MERHIRLQRPEDVPKARIATVHSSATAVLLHHFLEAEVVDQVEVADQVVVDQAGERPADRSASLLFTYE